MWPIDEAANTRTSRKDASTTDTQDRDDTLAALMVRDFVCVPAELELPALAAVFLEGGLSGAPVVDEAGKVMGMVSRTDLVRHHYDGGSDHQHGDRMTDVARCEAHRGAPDRRLTAGDIMTPFLFALPERASVADAAALMAVEGIHRLVVMRDGDMVGMVSALDVMKWLGKSARSGSSVPDRRQTQVSGRA